MKRSSAELISLLATSNEFVMTDTYTFTLPSGAVITYRDGQGGNKLAWIQHTQPLSQVWNRNTYSPRLRLFVAVGNGTHCVTSPDGVTWTSRNMPANRNWATVLWIAELGYFVAVAHGVGAGALAYSTDGVTWTGGNLPVDVTLWGGFGWNGTALVLIKNTPADRLTLTSPDGVTWTQHATAMPTSHQWDSCLWMPALGVFCAVAVETNAGTSATSPDGITWTAGTMPSGAGQHWRDIDYSPTLGLLVCTDWTPASTLVATSPDGLAWTQGTVPTAQQWTAILWVPETAMFIMLGYGPQSLTSTDGVHWAQLPMPSNLQWYILAYDSSDGIVVGQSIDGSTVGAATLQVT